MTYTSQKAPDLTQISAQTFRAYAASKILPLASALGFETDLPLLEDLVTALTLSWGDQLIGTEPRSLSEISCDGTPMDISLGFEGDRCELRFSVQPQPQSLTLPASWNAGCDTLELLVDRYGASLDTLLQVFDLFQPTDLPARFAMGLSFMLQPAQPAEFKIHLNPFVRGFDQSSKLIQTALQRLGFAHAWEFLQQVISKRGSCLDQPVLLGLDLAQHEDARIKVYFASYQPTIEHLEFLLSASPDHIPGDAYRLVKTLMGTEDPKFVARMPVIHYAFTTKDDTYPYAATLQLPFADYVENDWIAMQRICQFLEPQEREAYKRAIAALTNRSLKTTAGLHSYASFKRQKHQPRTTIYFAMEAYKVFPAWG